MGKKKEKKHKVKVLKKLKANNFKIADCKPKCCKKYKKSELKRCKRCPCFDLLKKHVA